MYYKAQYVPDKMSFELRKDRRESTYMNESFTGVVLWCDGTLCDEVHSLAYIVWWKVLYQGKALH